MAQKENELIKACKQGDVKTALDLIAQGVNVNAMGDGRDWETRQFTPLWAASAEGHTAVVKMLLEKGANINAKRGDGWTALMMAIAAKNVETARVLIDAAADLNARDHTGRVTALSLAKNRELQDLVALLEQRRAWSPV